jgi:hypothetical protein
VGIDPVLEGPVANAAADPLLLAVEALVECCGVFEGHPVTGHTPVVAGDVPAKVFADLPGPFVKQHLVGICMFVALVPEWEFNAPAKEGHLGRRRFAMTSYRPTA